MVVLVAVGKREIEKKMERRGTGSAELWQPKEGTILRENMVS